MWRWLLVASALLIASTTAQAQCVPGSDSTTFNASQDLHKVKIDNLQFADMVPNNSGLDSAPLLTAAIQYVTWTPGCSELIVDPGTYYFVTANMTPVAPKKYAYVYVPQGTGLKVDLRGAALVFQESYYSAFYINECNSCEFKNFSIDYQNLPFTQLNVTNLGTNQISVTPQAGWINQEQLYQHQVNVGRVPDEVKFLGFDTRGDAPLYGYTAWALPPPDGNPGTIMLNPQSVIRQNDVFIVATRGGGPAIQQQYASNGSFKDITIYTSGGPAIESWNSQGMSFIGIRVVPNTGRLVSTVAGGIQLNNMTGPGNLVRNCVIEGTQDDSIAGNMAAANATGEIASASIVNVTGTPPANPVFFMNGITGATAGAPNGQGFTLTATNSPSRGQNYTVSPSLTQAQMNLLGGTALIYGQAGFGADMSVTVQNNRIFNSYFARGIAFLGVSGASITDNYVTGTQQAGIVLSTELPSNVPIDKTLIANNHLLLTNMGMSGVGQYSLGAIQIMAWATNGNVMGKQLNRFAFINGNTVIQTQRAGIWVANMRGGALDQLNIVGGYGLSASNFGIQSHLYNGMTQADLITGFSQAVFAWCTVDFSGRIYSLCNPPAAPAK